MSETHADIQVISPVDNRVYYTCARAQQAWQNLPLSTRQSYVQALVDEIVANKDDIAAEICWQMGRPISQGGGEINGFKERADYMLAIADSALAAYYPQPIEGFSRYITREPLGTVAVLSPWNYPFLTSVNAIVPALVAGNCVILKHAAQTPKVAERYAAAAAKAALPEGVFQVLKLSHADTETLIADTRIDGVFFTGRINLFPAVWSWAVKTRLMCVRMLMSLWRLKAW